MTDHRQPRNETSSASPRLVWLTILIVGIVFFASAHSFSLSQVSDWSPSDDWAEEVEGGFSQTIKMISLSTLALLGVYLLLQPSKHSLRVGDLLPLLLLGYVALCAVSIAWSVSVLLSARRVALLAACCVAALGIVKQFSTRDVMMMALTVATAYLAIGVAAQIVTGTFQPFSGEFRFAGTMHPNAQGVNCALICLAGVGLAASNPSGRRLCLTLAAIGLVFLVLTKSRMSLAALIAAGGCFFALEVSRRTKTAVFISALALLFGTLLVGRLANLDVSDGLMHAVSLGRHEEMGSLTGRVPLWTELMPYVRESPILGYGYRAFWNREHTLAFSEALSGWQAPHAHSTYFDTVLDVGIPAAAVLILALLWAACRAATAYYRTGDPGYRFVHALLIFGLCDGLLDSNFTIPTFVPFVAACGALLVALRTADVPKFQTTEADAGVVTRWRPALPMMPR